MKFKNTLLKRYWLTYAFFAFIPVITITIILTGTFQRNYDETAKELLIQACTKTGTYLDTLFNDMQTRVNSLSSNRNIVDLYESGEEEKLESLLCSYLALTRRDSRIPVETLFYFVGEKTIYTTDGRMDYKAFEDTMLPLADLNASSFLTHLNAAKEMEAQELQPAHGAENANSYVAFIFPLFKEDMGKLASFAYIVSMEDIVRIVDDFLGISPNYLYIYNQNLTARIGMYEMTPLSDAERLNVLKSRPEIVGTAKLGRESYDVCRTLTDKYGFQIIACVHLQKLYGSMETVHLSSVIGLITALLLIIGVSGVIAYILYRPLRQVLSGIDESAQGDDLNEMERIDRYISNTHLEMDRMKKRIEIQTPFVRNHFLQQLLRGTVTETMTEQFEWLFPEIGSSKGKFYVVLISGEASCLTQMQENLEAAQPESAEIFCVYLDAERILALLVFDRKEEADRERCCERILENQKGAPADRRICIGAGKPVTQLSEISTSFLEAYIALNETSVQQSICLYEPGIMSGSRGIPYLYNGDLTRIYLQSLKSANQAKATKMLDELLSETSAPLESSLLVNYARVELYAQTIAVCERDVAERFVLQAGDLKQFSDAAAFAEQMHRLTEENCHAMEAKRSTASKDVRRLIMETLREKYTDADFSLTALSDRVGYSATYINRCLKEETGYSFIQYVSALRLSKAKELLRQINMGIQEIVTAVGYRDVASFTRKFREAEGVSPGQYREMQ